jgi:D-alanyl-D-alanine dipeptidase
MRAMRLPAVIAIVAAACAGRREPPAPAPIQPPGDAAAVATPIDAAPAPIATVDAAPPDATAPLDLAGGADDDWIDIARAIPDAVIDMRYATPDNFTKQKLYPIARCLLRRSVAVRLVRAAASLRDADRRIVLWDCYRPAALQQLLWDLVRDPRYVAEPRYDRDGKPLSGSRHSRGAAVDISLADRDGKPIAMPTAHDHFGKEAHRNRAAKSAAAADYAVLDRAMTGAGFVGMATEWWHYDAKDAARFALADVALDTPP